MNDNCEVIQQTMTTMQTKTPLQWGLMLGQILNCSKEHYFLMHSHAGEELCSSESLSYDQYTLP